MKREAIRWDRCGGGGRWGVLLGVLLGLGAAPAPRAADTALGAWTTYRIDVRALGTTAGTSSDSTGPGYAYGKSPELTLFPESDGGVTVYWQDYARTRLNLTTLTPDLSQWNLTLPAALGHPGSCTRDPEGNWYYLTAQTSQAPQILLVKADPAGRELRRRTLDAGRSEFNVWTLDSVGGAWLDYANGRLCLVLARTMNTSGDGLNHQGSIVAMFRSDDLSTVRNFGQNSGHSFGSRVLHDGANFLTMSLGDNYPRGIIVHKVNDARMDGRVVYTFKTRHGSVPSPYRKDANGVPLAPGKWSNDNATYTELGDIVRQPHGYAISFTSEPTADNDFTGADINEARNVGFVLLHPSFETFGQSGNVVPPGMILSRGVDSPAFGFYTFDGGYSPQQYRGVVWLTSYTDRERENASRPKMVALEGDRLLLLWEKWTRSAYVGTYGKIIDEWGTTLVPETALGRLRLGRGDGIVRQGNRIHLLTGTGDAMEWSVLELPDTGNRAPIAAIVGPSRVAARATATYSVQATDPDADPLFVYWEVEGGNFGHSGPTFDARWLVGGASAVNVTVSDHRGGVARVRLAVDVGDAELTWTRAASGTTRDLRDITFAQGLFVAVGDGTLLQSIDGLAWVPVETPPDLSNEYLRAVVHDGTRFVAVGMKYDFDARAWVGSVRTSADGKRWERTALPGVRPFRAGAAGAGAVVALTDVGELYQGVVGGPWQRAPAAADASLQSVAYGNGRFLAVGYGKVRSSTDGWYWADLSVAGNGVEPVSRLTYGRGRFYASGYGGVLRSSADGVGSWAAVGSAGGGFGLNGLVDGAGMLVGVGDRYDPASGLSESVEAVSTDGTEWGTRSRQENPVPNAVAYGNGVFVSVGSQGVILRGGSTVPGNRAPTVRLSGPTSLAVRTGAVFAVEAADPDGDPVRVFWDDGSGLLAPGERRAYRRWTTGGDYALRAVVSDGRGGLAEARTSVAVSETDLVWTRCEGGSTLNFADVAFGAGQFVAAGQGGLARSADGTRWEWLPTAWYETGSGICHDGLRFVMVGSSYDFNTRTTSSFLRTSNDARQWIRAAEVYAPQLYSVASRSGITVAVGQEGTIFRSVDGSPWTKVESGTREALVSVAAGNGRFLAVGSKALLVSDDGRFWEDRTASRAGVGSFLFTGFARGRFFGIENGIATSPDGVTGWQMTFPVAWQNRLRPPAYGAGLFLAVGSRYDPASGFNDTIELVSEDGISWNSRLRPELPAPRAIAFGNGIFVCVGEGGSIHRSRPVQVPGVAWAAWRDSVLVDEPFGDAGDDADGDGLANFAEYALGTDPKSAASVAGPRVVVLDGYAHLQLARSAGAPDARIQVEVATSPNAGWTSDGVQVIEDSPDWLRVRYARPVAEQRALFFRVRYALP